MTCAPKIVAVYQWSSAALTLPQTFGMWKLAQLSQNKQINFPVLIAFSWSSACPHSNHCLNTLIKFKNVPITTPSSQTELDFQSTRQDMSRVTVGTLQGALFSPAPPHPTLLQSTGLVHCKAQRCGWGRVDKKGNLTFTLLFLTLFCLEGPAACLAISVSSIPHENRFFKASCRRLCVTSLDAIIFSSLPSFPNLLHNKSEHLRLLCTERLENMYF